MEHDIPFGNSNRENGPTCLDFPLFLGIFQWDEPTKRVALTAEPEIPEILAKWKAPRFSTFSGKNVFHLPPNRKFRKFWLNGKRPKWPTIGVIIYRYVSRLPNINFYWPLCPTVFCYAYCFEKKVQINGTVIPWTILFHRIPSAKMMKNRIPQS